MAGQQDTHHDAASPQAIKAEIDFAALFQIAPVGLAVLDPDLRYISCNDELAHINGIPARDHLGRSVRELLPELAGQVEPRFRKVFRTGKAQGGLKVSGFTPKAPGQRRSWLESVTPLKDPGGGVRHILVSVQEITAVEAMEASLQASERTLSASQRLSPDGLTIIRAIRDEDGRVTDFVWEYGNAAALEIIGADPLVGQRLSQVLPGSPTHPDLFPRYVGLLSNAEASEVELSYEKDGKVLWFRDAAVGIDADRVAVAFRNISVRKRMEEQLRLVSGEYRHRVKNLIAVVEGLVVQMAKSATSVTDFSAALRQRLSALAAAQDLLSADEGGDVPLERIVQTALAAFLASRLQIEAGPPVSLRPQEVTLVTMALHELATNAVKHGALSVPTGSTCLGWKLNSGRVELTWTETGGPIVSPPRREGFGSRLLTDSIRRLPHGVLRRDFRPEGLQATIAFDLLPGGAP